MSSPFLLQPNRPDGISAVLQREIGDAVLLVSPRTETQPVAIQVVEPFTWAWVGIMLAEGVLAYVGGKIFEAAFFPNSKNEDLIRFISAKIDEAVAKLQRYIDEALEELTVRNALRDSLGLYNSLREHVTDPGATDLKSINQRANELWSELFRRRESAFMPACLTASLKAATLHTRFLEASKAEKNGARENLIRFLDEAIASLSQWKEEIFRKHHIFELTDVELPACHDEPEFDPGPRSPTLDESFSLRRIIHHWTCSTGFRANGRPFTFSSGDRRNQDDAFNDVMNQAQAAFAVWRRRRDETEPFVRDNILIPGEAIIARLREARASVPK